MMGRRSSWVEGKDRIFCEAGKYDWCHYLSASQRNRPETVYLWWGGRMVDRLYSIWHKSGNLSRSVPYMPPQQGIRSGAGSVECARDVRCDKFKLC